MKSEGPSLTEVKLELLLGNYLEDILKLRIEDRLFLVAKVTTINGKWLLEKHDQSGAFSLLYIYIYHGSMLLFRLSYAKSELCIELCKVRFIYIFWPQFTAQMEILVLGCLG